MAYDTERDSIALGPVEIPPLSGGIPTTIQPRATEEQITAAVGQLNAGQPVTALPRQSWDFNQQQAWIARMDEFDRQAKAARIARDQAARDAQLLDQMSRVAKSTKDIEVAMQAQDTMGFRNAVATGTPALQALQRFPRAATSPLVAAAKAAQPITAPTLGTVPGMGKYLVDSAGKPHFQPASTVEAPMQESLQGIPVYDHNGNVIGTGVRETRTGQYRVFPDKASPEETSQRNELDEIIKRDLGELSDLQLRFPNKDDAPADKREKMDALERRLNENRAKRQRIGTRPASSGGPMAQGVKYVRVRGPNGQTGKMPQGSNLPTGWQLIP